MQEASFMKGLVEEIRRSKDPRFKAVNEWCLQVAQKLQSCDGDAEKQELHVAVVTWELLIGISELEESLTPDTIALAATYTACNENDRIAPQYSIKIDFNEKSIVVTVSTIDVGLVILEQRPTNGVPVLFEPLILPLSTTVKALLEARKSVA